MRVLFMGLAALAVLLVSYSAMQFNTVQVDVSSIPAIVAVVSADVPAAPNASGVVVTASYTYTDNVLIADMANVAPEVAAAVASTRPTVQASTLNGLSTI